MFHLLPALLHIAMNHQDELCRARHRTPTYHGMPFGAFLREVRTIRLDVGRQTGKTRMIIDYATDTDITFVYNMDMARYMKSEKLKGAVGTFRVQKEKYALNTFSTVWVDNASLCKPAELDNIYDIAAECQANRVILLG